MKSKEVAVSGTVGKQSFAITADQAVLRGISLVMSGANGSVVIRDGATSGTVKHTVRGLTASNLVNYIELPGRGERYDNGMHVKVLGTGTLAYLFVD